MSKDSHVLSNSWGGVEYSQALQVLPFPFKSMATSLT